MLVSAMRSFIAMLSVARALASSAELPRSPQAASPRASAASAIMRMYFLRFICGDNAAPAAWLPPPSSAPGRQRRKAHQDGVDIASGPEPEQGAAVVDQVELGV